MLEPTLTAHLDLTAIGDADFELRCPLAEGGRLLGSGLLAVIVLAARRTVDERYRPVAAATTFTRAGDPMVPLRVLVERLHTGRSVVLVVVRAVQGDRPSAVATVRFHDAAASGPDGDWPEPVASRLPPPVECRAEDSVVATMRVLAGFDIRAAVPAGSVERRVVHPFWVRSREMLPEQPGIHEAVVGILTDVGVTASAAPPHLPFRERRLGVTLDHSLWWHRAPRVDEWIAVSAEPLVVHAGRALARGTVHDESGRLVASFGQEVLLRPGR